jgi:hypothetical protein
MPQSGISRLANRIVQNKNDASKDSLVRPSPKSSGINRHSGIPRVQFEEPFESIMHIEIPRPPPEIEASKPPSILSPRQSRHARRKLAAARRWNTEVLPALIQPYMGYERMLQSGSLALSSGKGTDHFLCGCTKQLLLITCVYLDRMLESVNSLLLC